MIGAILLIERIESMQLFGIVLAALMLVSGIAGAATANEPPPLLITG